jgi:hypothetical protein
MSQFLGQEKETMVKKDFIGSMNRSLAGAIALLIVPVFE